MKSKKLTFDVFSYKGYSREYTSFVEEETDIQTIFSLADHHKKESEKDDDFGDVRLITITPGINDIMKITIEY